MDNSPSTYVERPLQTHLHCSSTAKNKDTIDLLKLWRVIWRAKWNIGWLVLLSCALAIAAVSTITPQYIGSTTLLFKDKTPPLLSFQQVNGFGQPTPPITCRHNRHSCNRGTWPNARSKNST